MTSSSESLVDPPLLERYLAGHCTPDESRQVEQWIAQRPVRGAFLQQLRTDPGAATAVEIDALWRHVVAHIDAGHNTVSSPRRPMRSGSYRYLLGAAAAAVVCVVGYLGLQRRQPANAPAAPTIYRTQSMQVARVTLDDGTRVILAPNSVLSASSLNGTRDITLTGRAYFEVAIHRDAPFLVHTGSVVTRVLGTSFDVTHYSADPDVRVAVTTGKVMLLGRQSVTLVAGDVGRMSDSTVATVVSGDASTYAGWTDGALAFHWTPVPELLRTVGHWYGVEFRLADTTLALRHVTATFHQETRAEALQLLQTVLDATMTFETTTDGKPIVTIHARCGARTSTPPKSSRTRRESVSHPITEVGR